jgi:ParB family chromosome partitioning protein
VGKDRTSVSNALRLLKLPGEVQSMLARGDLSAGHARALLTLDNARAQMSLAERIKQRGLSVRSVENLVRKKKSDTIRINMVQSRKPAELRELEERLQRILGTAVRIVRGSKKSRLEIEFYSDEDLERILAIIGSEDPSR